MTEIPSFQPAHAPKHTPGPWEAYTDCTGRCCWLVRQVGTEDEPGDGVTWPETSEENARLIAAAPELLAFVQELLSDYQSLEGMASMKYYAGKAHSAIAKATGAQA